MDSHGTNSNIGEYVRLGKVASILHVFKRLLEITQEGVTPARQTHRDAYLRLI
jgi:hypothetical protein